MGGAGDEGEGGSSSLIGSGAEILIFRPFPIVKPGDLTDGLGEVFCEEINSNFSLEVPREI